MHLRGVPTSVRRAHAAWRTRFLLSRPIACVVAASLVALALSTPAPAAATDHAAYRDDLVDLMRVLAELRTRLGPDAPGSSAEIERAAWLFAGFSDQQVDSLDAFLPASRLHAIVSESRRSLQSAPKTAIVVEPDVSPTFCNDYPAPIALAALGTKHVAQHVIKALEFSCLQTTLGINAALGCEAPEIAATAADIASNIAGFCGGQQSAATNTAALATQRSIARHLDLQLDVELSTRATQASLDTAKTSADSGVDGTTDLRGQLDQDAVLIASQIDDAVQDLSAVVASVTDLQARSADIAFNMQANQGVVEDIERRGADLQQRGDELVVAFETHDADMATLLPRASALAPAIASAARSERRDALAMALGDPQAAVATFALPAAAGGSLEGAREVLIETLVALQALGQGDTVQASTRLAAGDAAYNEGRYADAWREFATAYRTLDPHAAAGATP